MVGLLFLIYIYIHMMRSKYNCAGNEDPRQNIKLVTVRFMKKLGMFHIET